MSKIIAGIKYSDDMKEVEDVKDKTITSAVIPAGVTEIGGWAAFDGCTSLSSVFIPASVTKIGIYAFSDCTLLSSVEFGGTKVQWEAVEGKLYLLGYIPAKSVKCADGEWEKPVLLVENGVVVKCLDKSATSVEVPASVTEIGRSAFLGCTSLSSVEIPSGVTEIGYNAFADCSSLASVEFGGTKAVWESVEGKANLLSDIPANSVKCADGKWEMPFLLVENGVVVDCQSNAISVLIPKNVKKIGNSAFENCNVLSSIVIPAGVTEIGKYAFDGCALLVSVEIPESVTKIGDYAFRDCTSLSSVEFDGTKAQWEAVEGKLNLLEYVPAKGVKCADGKWEMPFLLVENGVVVDCQSNAISVVIPENAKKIGNSAFKNCNVLSSIAIPAGVTEIGNSAFDGCALLESVSLPESVTKIGDYAFRHCTSLSSVVIPASVTEIGEGAFWFCTSLSSIVLPKGITKISAWTFDGCTSLVSVEIPSGVTEIGDSAFDYCTSLSSVSIPAGVTKIGEEAFWSCTSLSSIVLPKGITEINEMAFRDCSSLVSVEIPSGVTEIGESAFGWCTSLSSVSIPAGVTEINEMAFRGCSSLSSVEIPEGIVEIGAGAFEDCTSLKSISLPSTLKKIGKDAFKGCGVVESIASDSELFPFNEKTKKLYDATGKINKCILMLNAAKEEAKREKIKGIQLASAGAVLDSIVQAHPSVNVQVRKEEKECFVAIQAKDGGVELCLANSKVQKWMQTLLVLLDKAANNATAAELREYAKANDLPDASRKYFVIFKDGKVKMKKNSKPVYLTIPDGVTVIDEWAFNCCSSLASVAIPESVTEIGEFAFFVCTSLDSVVIPSSVTKIGRFAFFHCNITEAEHPCLSIKNGVAIKGDVVMYCTSQASQITIPAGITKIGEWAFYACASLVSVAIPESVTEIGYEAFHDCSSLSSVVIPAGVTKICYEAFWDCTSLASVEFGGTKAQWESVKKGNDWNKGVPATRVKCADGEVEL